MDLGQLAPQRHSPRPQHLRDIVQSFQYPVRRFIENQRRWISLHLFQRLPALRFLSRKKAAEEERVRRQSGCAQRADQRRCPRDRRHRYAMRPRLRHQPITRIGDQRRAGVRYQRDVLASLQLAQQLFRASLLVVFVIAHQRLRNAVAVQQLARLPRVLARDLVHFPKNAQGAQRDVLQVADRGRDDVECSAHADQYRSLATCQQAGESTPRSSIVRKTSFSLHGPTSARTLAPGLISPPATIDASGCIS